MFFVIPFLPAYSKPVGQLRRELMEKLNLPYDWQDQRPPQSGKTYTRWLMYA
jgi:hypothetical protein